MADSKTRTDFETLIKSFAADDGSIPASAFNAVVTAVRNAVGTEYVEKERYAAKLAEIRKLNEDRQTAEDNAATSVDWKKKYEDEHAAHEAYRAEIAAKETLAAKQTAYRGLLADANIAEKYRDKVLKYTDFDAVELDEKGKLKGAAALLRAVKEEWPEYVETDMEGSTVQPPNPPANNGSGARTREDILKIEDAGERQQAIAEELAKGSGLF